MRSIFPEVELMEIKRFLQEISLEIDQLFGDSQDCLQAEVTASKTISMENVTDETGETGRRTRGLHHTKRERSSVCVGNLLNVLTDDDIALKRRQKVFGESLLTKMTLAQTVVKHVCVRPKPVDHKQYNLQLSTYTCMSVLTIRMTFAFLTDYMIINVLNRIILYQ